MIVVTLSGLQDYLFDIADKEGGQAKALRARSDRLLDESNQIERALCEATGCDKALMRGGAKFVLNTGKLDADKQKKAVETLLSQRRRLFQEHQGRLRVAAGMDFESPDQFTRFQSAQQRMLRDKLSPWADERALVLKLLDRSDEAKNDKIVGAKLGNDGAVPLKPDGQPLDFEDIATKSTGTPMLGVLAADVDNLGQAFMNAKTIEVMRTLSNKLSRFFGTTLKDLIKDKFLYLVYSGGDDALLVGPWDKTLGFAGELNTAFHNEFKADNLTFSAGLAIVKPRFPVRLAARQAGNLLQCAKDAGRNRVAALGGMWQWTDHNAIITQARNLLRWISDNNIKRGWLHTLLELALLRRGEPHRGAGHSPAVATSRLAYHIARNWPKNGDARHWADEVLEKFKNWENGGDVTAAHLPVVLRHAMLATRAGGED